MSLFASTGFLIAESTKIIFPPLSAWPMLWPPATVWVRAMPFPLDLLGLVTTVLATYVQPRHGLNHEDPSGASFSSDLWVVCDPRSYQPMIYQCCLASKFRKIASVTFMALVDTPLHMD